jgi:glutamyl-tRNA(Gln) amidotransferase subunit E
MVKFYDLDGVFHSDELPEYGISENEVAEIRRRLELGAEDAFVLIGGTKAKVDLAVKAVVQRLKASIEGVTAETRAATPDGTTVFLRPRPGAARMYPETDIPTLAIADSRLESLADRVPRHWDVEVETIAKKYGLNKKLATQIFDSEYLGVFEHIADATRVSPTFVASKLTEDLVNLQRQGHDNTALTDDAILEVFSRLDSGSIAKESIVPIFEMLMKKQVRTVQEAVKATGASSVGEDELGRILDKVIEENMGIVKQKGMAALSTLMGRSMAVARGKADGQKINAMLKEKLAKLVG